MYIMESHKPHNVDMGCGLFAFTSNMVLRIGYNGETYYISNKSIKQISTG
jgi:YHS domain-containing protein